MADTATDQNFVYREQLMEEGERLRDTDKKAKRSRELAEIRSEDKERLKRMEENERKRMETADQQREIRKRLREDRRQATEERLTADYEEKQHRIINADESIEIVRAEGKANWEVEEDPRMAVIPSALLCPGEDRAQRTNFDNIQFAINQESKFLEDRISDYIAVMIDFFDREPYYEKETALIDKNGTTSYKVETIPNDLPTFSEFGFAVGLSSDDIEILKTSSPRFNHAYKLCQEKMEFILSTNMLQGLYASQASTFAAKNLLGWRNETSVNIDGNVGIGEILEGIIAEEGDDFVE